ACRCPSDPRAMTYAPIRRDESLGVADSFRRGSDFLGVYRAADFRVTDGARAGPSTIASARWYFETETIAVPKPGLPPAGYARGMATFDDVRAWQAARSPD